MIITREGQKLEIFIKGNRHAQRMANGTPLQERFAQVLVPPGTEVPKTSFGEAVLGEHTYAVSYEDSARKIPEPMRLKLSPRISTDMYGTPRASFMIHLPSFSGTPSEELDQITERHEKSDLIIKGVHHVMTQEGTVSRSVTRTIHGRQVFYFQRNDAFSASTEQVEPFRREVLQGLTTLFNGKLPESLHDFKHIVQLVKRGKKVHFRYELPADLSEKVMQTLGAIELQYEAGPPEKRKEYTASFIIDEHQPCVYPFRPRTHKDPKETGIISVYKRFALHPEQGYLKQYMNPNGARLTHLAHASTTCKEKRDSLFTEGQGDWSIDSVISAHYYRGSAGYVVLVGPRLESIEDEKKFVAVAAKRDDLQHGPEALPLEMERGTCTPFMRRRTAVDSIDRIIMLQLPDQVMHRLADYSIGGHGPSAHRASLHITPNDAQGILVREFGPDKVMTSLRHPYAAYWS
jgi:hypothetical protein